MHFIQFGGDWGLGMQASQLVSTSSILSGGESTESPHKQVMSYHVNMSCHVNMSYHVNMSCHVNWGLLCVIK